MKKILLSLGLLVMSEIGYATVLVDTQTASGLNATAGRNEWSMTIGNGVSRGLVVACYENLGSPVNISSVTVGVSTNALTLALRHRSSINQVEIWYSTNVPTGPNTISVNLPGGTQGSSFPCGAVALNNVDQDQMIDVSTGVATTGTSHTATYTTTVSSSMLLDTHGQGTVFTAYVAGSGQTQRFQNLNVPSFRTMQGSTKLSQASGSQTMTWDGANSQGVIGITAIRPNLTAPNLANLSPNTVQAGVSTFTLTVNGSGFVNGATVTWNGANLVTTFVSQARVTAVVNNADVDTIEIVSVRVINPNNAMTDIAPFNVSSRVNYFWVTDGGYKPVYDDTYGIEHSTVVTNTRIWNGTTAKLFGGRNETIGAFIVMEDSGTINASNVKVNFGSLVSSSGYVISSTPTSNVMDWNNKPVEMFKYECLVTSGVTRNHWEFYDERHVPARMRRPCTVGGLGNCVANGGTGWTDRPDHDKCMPDIAIPWEVVMATTSNNGFSVGASSSMMIGLDIYIPKEAPPGVYRSMFTIYEGASISTAIPFEVMVYPFELPDKPLSKNTAYISNYNISGRHHGQHFPNYGGLTSSMTVTRLNYYKMLHRHGISAVGDTTDTCGSANLAYGPCPEAQEALTGRLFDPTTGYANARGVQTGDQVYFIGSYNHWINPPYWIATQESMCTNAKIWSDWFTSNAPWVDYYVYTRDEPSVSQLEELRDYGDFIANCPVPYNEFPLLVTHSLATTYSTAPLTTIALTSPPAGLASTWYPKLQDWGSRRNKRLGYYNGTRPYSGTMALDDDGVSWFVNSWMHYKLRQDLWFIWESTYYNDTNNGQGETPVFRQAKTFGPAPSFSTTYGYTSGQYSNSDGLLMYPGTDLSYPQDNYSVDGPFASMRLKLWRRGIQDYDYLKMAEKIDAKAVKNIVDTILPRVVYEYGVTDADDPTYLHSDISWTTNTDVWDRARERLAQIISSHRK
jgi:hypothetical protein